MNKALVERLSNAERQTHYPNVRPKDAATLLILDRQANGEFKVLMGRRHQRHRFMPGMFVFPGGRVDPADSRVPVIGNYHPDVLQKLAYSLKGPKTDARTRAFAVAAVRETYEEAGVFVGSKADADWQGKGDFAAFSERCVMPDLSPMRLIARAITPPRRPRRFDTRFLAVPADAIADQLAEGTGPSGELEDVHWLTLDAAKNLELPTITLTIIEELQNRLSADRDLAPETPVPFYYWRRKGFIREEV
ncbi:NUDIX domain-containing protein [Stappia sp. GBMRC 2046]|uniref:NUDIX domain-containing protein n=1 Tax=Stappia sediminis TaxID=2692190 RepID=A0A7X3S6R7_9HYPH|nr:NUDIX hydrolase [Stappia sediminis]MXN64157.1 NUDIX domain-containing protein [Stappia sediminis]